MIDQILFEYVSLLNIQLINFKIPPFHVNANFHFWIFKSEPVLI